MTLYRQYRKFKRTIFKSLGRKEFQPKRPWRFWIKRRNRVNSKYLKLEKVYSHDHIRLRVQWWEYGKDHGAGSVVTYDNKEWLVMQVPEQLCFGDDSDSELYCRAYDSSKEKRQVHCTIWLHRALVLVFVILAPVWIILLMLGILIDIFIEWTN